MSLSRTVSEIDVKSDFDWLLTGISRSRYFSTLNISETARDRAIVTIEHQSEVIGCLSNGDILNDLHGPPGFKVTAFLKSNI